MFNKKAADALYSLFVPKTYHPTPKPPANGKPILNVPRGNVATAFYTYSWPRERLAAGDWIQLTYHPGKRKLTSDFTGNSETADGVFTYDGVVVGCTFNGYFLDRIKPLAKTRAVRVYAYCRAWNRAGYPELELRADFKAVKKG